MTYKINIDGITYTVEVPVTAPNEGATWEHILAAAKADSGILSNPLVSGDPAKLDSLLWSDGEGAPSKTGGKQYPANAEFTGYGKLSFNVNGKTVEVADKDGDGKATWAEIKAAAIAQDVEVDNPAVPSDAGGYSFTVWKGNGSDVADSTEYNPGATFSPVFEKEVSYTIVYGPTNTYTSTNLKR